VLVGRLSDTKRRGCDAKVELSSIASFVRPWLEASDQQARAALARTDAGKRAVAQVQAELVCAGLLDRRAAPGVLDAKTDLGLDACGSRVPPRTHGAPRGARPRRRVLRRARANGLAMFIHEEPVMRGDETRWLDHGIRSHGSVDHRSIARGNSHDCHRLYDQLVLRMSGFVLQHRSHVDRGKLRAGYQRTLAWNEQTIEVDVPTHGHLYELDPPIPVSVLAGRIAGEAQKPAKQIRLASR
jgi:hypothetical protein